MENTTSEKAKGPTVTAVSPLKTGRSAHKFSPKSTATEAQYQRIVTMLRISIRSTFDFHKAGIMAPAARIKELNDKHGYYIPTIALRDLWDDEGFMHPRVAIYELIDEPHGERAQ